MLQGQFQICEELKGIGKFLASERKSTVEGNGDLALT